jgi:hypothetical protein
MKTKHYLIGALVTIGIIMLLKKFGGNVGLGSVASQI